MSGPEHCFLRSIRPSASAIPNGPKRGRRDVRIKKASTLVKTAPGGACPEPAREERRWGLGHLLVLGRLTRPQLTQNRSDFPTRPSGLNRSIHFRKLVLKMSVKLFRN